MALPRVGVQVVVQDMQKFTRDIAQVNKDIQKTATNMAKIATPMMGTALGGLGDLIGTLAMGLTTIQPELAMVIGLFGALQKVFAAILKPIKAAWDAIVGFAKDLAGKVWEGMKAFAKGVFDFFNPIPELFDMIKRTASIAFGVLVRDSIRAVGDAVRNLAANALEAASNFQLLEIRLRGLSLRDIMDELDNKGIEITSETMAQAFQDAAKEAKTLLLWVSRLAIQSPFSTQDVANAFTMAKGFGLTTELAKQSTEAVMNFAAGMGLTGDQMEKILINFGQMWTQGKITGTELRDLARGSLVPTTRIFELMGEKVGKTAAEMRKLASEGKLNVVDFITTFNEMAMSDFPDAAKNMTRTLAGLKEKLTDFGETYFGMFLIKPSLDILTGRLSEFFDLFMGNERFLAAIETLGSALGTLFDSIFNPSISTDVVDKISAFLETLARLMAAISTGDAMLIQEIFKQMGIPQWVIDAANSLWGAIQNIKDILVGSKDIIVSALGDILGAFGIQIKTEDGVPAVVGWLEGLNTFLTENKGNIISGIQEIAGFVTTLMTGEVSGTEVGESESSKKGGQTTNMTNLEKMALSIRNMAKDVSDFANGVRVAFSYWTPELKDTVQSISTNIGIMVSILSGEPLDPAKTGAGSFSVILQIIDMVLGYINTKIVIFNTGLLILKKSAELVEKAFSAISLMIATVISGIISFGSKVSSLAGIFETYLGIPDGSVYKIVAAFVNGVITMFTNMWNTMTQHSIIPDMMDDIEDSMVGGFKDTFKQSEKLADKFTGAMQASATMASGVPFAAGGTYNNNSSYQYTFNANYAQTQSPVTLKYDIEALLAATKV